MKKALLLSLLLVFSSLFSFAQKIITNDFLDDGSRSVLCGLKILDYNNIDGVALGCIALDNKVDYNLFLTIGKDNIQISEGKKLLIKLGDGSIIELVCRGKEVSSHVAGYANIPESVMDEIISKKITKMRVEYDSGYIDIDITDDELSNELKKMYNKLNEVLTPIDIYSGF